MSSQLEESEYSKPSSFVGRSVAVIGLMTLALGPILGRYVSEHAVPRWQLAYAANQLEKGEVDSAKLLLDKAYARDPSLLEDFHFVQVRFDSILADSQKEASQAEAIEEFTDELVKAYRSRLIRDESLDEPSGSSSSNEILGARAALLAEVIASELLERGYAKQAVALMEPLFPPMGKRGASRNNLLAYCRAIAGYRLDVALKEINSALGGYSSFDNSALLDTKAWVLHQRKENLLALEFADRAIDRLYESLPKQLTSGPNAVLGPDLELSLMPLEELADEGSELSAALKNSTAVKLREQGLLPASVMRDLLRNVAVMRLHRILILESLNRSEASLIDLIWLRSYGFDNWDELR